MRILILGGGQDGIIISFLLKTLYGIKPYLAIRKKYHCLFDDYSFCYEVGSFINNIETLSNLIKEIKPTHIINTVAMSSTLECNKNKELAYQINSLFPEKLGKIISNYDIKLVHFGSILEMEKRNNCTYTKTKKLASNLLNKLNKSNQIINLALPNHESPLRDERFFIRELITKFSRIKNDLKDEKKIITLLNGTILRSWSWAPNLMNEVIIMTLEDKNEINFEKHTIKLSLIELTASVCKMFEINDLTINCKISGSFELSKIEEKSVSNSFKSWLYLLFSIRYEERYFLENWCHTI